MLSLFDPLSRGSSILYGACGGVWVMLLFQPPNIADIRLARTALSTMSKRFSQGFPTITWVLPSAGFSMDSDSRHASAEITQTYSNSILAGATLIEGSGFQAATARAIISGIDMLARAKYQKKVFNELQPCVDWCVDYRPSRTGPSTAEIVHALSDLRGTFS